MRTARSTAGGSRCAHVGSPLCNIRLPEAAERSIIQTCKRANAPPYRGDDEGNARWKQKQLFWLNDHGVSATVFFCSAGASRVGATLVMVLHSLCASSSDNSLAARHTFVQVAGERHEKQREKYDDVFAKCSLIRALLVFFLSLSLYFSV